MDVVHRPAGQKSAYTTAIKLSELTNLVLPPFPSLCFLPGSWTVSALLPALLSVCLEMGSIQKKRLARGRRKARLTLFLSSTTEAAQVGPLGKPPGSPKIWTRSAKVSTKLKDPYQIVESDWSLSQLFIISISLFVVSTVLLLVALEVLNVFITYSNHVLLPQSIASE